MGCGFTSNRIHDAEQKLHLIFQMHRFTNRKAAMPKPMLTIDQIVHLIIMQTYQFEAIIIVSEIINQVLYAMAHVRQFIYPLIH